MANESTQPSQSNLMEGPVENPNMSKPDWEAEARIRKTQTPQQAVTQTAPVSRSSTTPQTTTQVAQPITQEQYPARMQQSVGATTDNKIYTADSPEVQAEMAKYPGLSIDAAIGNVTMRRSQLLEGKTPIAIKDGIVDADYAKQEQQRMLREIEAEKRQIDEAPDYLADFYAKEEANRIDEKDLGKYAANPELQAIDNEYKEYIAQLEAMRGKLEQRNQQTIDDIRRVYTDMREQQKLANTNRLKAQEIIGTRSGRQRYAPVIQEGVLSAEEKAGLKRLSDLQAEEERLVNQAIAAKEDGDFKLVQEIFSAKTAARKAKNEELDRVHKLAMEREQLSIAKMQREKLERDQTLEQLSQLSIMGPGTLSESDASFLDDYLKMPKGFSQAYVDFNVKARAEKTEASQMESAKAYLDMVMKIPEGETIVIPGYGAVTGMKEVDLSKGIMHFDEEGADGSISRNYIQVGKDGSISILESFQTKAPELKNLDTTTQKAVMLQALAGINMPVTDKKNATEMISAMIEDGNIEGAKEQLKSYIFNTATSTQQEKLEGKEDTIGALKTIQTMIDEYEAKDGELNVFTGLSEEALQKGGFTKDPKLAELANTIGLAIIDYRRAVSGAAFTESEAKAYDALFPSIGKTSELNKAKINSLINKLEADTENFYKRRIGESKYDEIFGSKQQSLLGGGGLEPLVQNYMNLDLLLTDNPSYVDMAKEVADLLVQNDPTLNNNPTKLDALVLEQIYDIQGFNQSLNKDSKGSYIPISQSKLNSLKEGQTKLAIGEGIITGFGSDYWKAGLDFVVKGGKGAKVKTPMSGEVVDVRAGYSNPRMTPLPYKEGKKQNGGFGNQVKIRYANGVEIWYSHLDSVFAKKGQKVPAGYDLGTQGNTGITYGRTGVHVDITGLKPDGKKYTAREVAALLGDRRLFT